MPANGTILRKPDLVQPPFRGQKKRQNLPGRPGAATKVTHRAWSVAVEVGFEPTEGLPLHTLSSTARHRSPPFTRVPDQCEQAAMVAGERVRTGVNETKTEPRSAWIVRLSRPRSL